MISNWEITSFVVPLSMGYSPPCAERQPNIRLTCEAELARNLHEDFSRLRDKPPSQVEAIVMSFL
jgi:hypothetical protein